MLKNQTLKRGSRYVCGKEDIVFSNRGLFAFGNIPRTLRRCPCFDRDQEAVAYLANESRAINNCLTCCGVSGFSDPVRDFFCYDEPPGAHDSLEESKVNRETRSDGSHMSAGPTAVDLQGGQNSDETTGSSLSST